MARTVVEGDYAGTLATPLRAEVSGTSWGAIVGGAVGATVVALVLVLLGSGMGLTAISPWSSSGISAETIGVWTIAWLVVTQWIASGIGGYLAGRLRARWTTVPADEVFFRDTAHGFLAWALSILVAATLLGTTIAGIAGATVQTAATAAGPAVAEAASGAMPAAGGAQQRGPDSYTGYLADRLMRPAAPSAAATSTTTGTTSTTIVGTPSQRPDTRMEARRILAAGLADQISDDDRDYLVQLVSTNAGISQQEASTRVDETIARIESAKVSAQEAADKARKAAATIAIVGALSLVIGAFIASVAGALGGHLRDEP